MTQPIHVRGDLEAHAAYVNMLIAASYRRTLETIRRNYEPSPRGLPVNTTAPAQAVRLDYDDYRRYTERHPDGDFELLDGLISEVSSERDPHALTRNGIAQFLNHVLDLKKYTAWTETSFRAPGWKEGPKPANSVSIGPLLVDGQYAKRPESKDIALVIEYRPRVPTTIRWNASSRPMPG